MPDESFERGLETKVRDADPYRWLATRFISDPKARADVVALYAFDHELARARRVASSPLIAEIRLTWWGEVLDEACSGGTVRAHPVARALAQAIRRRSLAREPLQAMIHARLDLLDPTPMTAEDLGRWASAVGGSAAQSAAEILDPIAPPAAVSSVGCIWGLVMAAREIKPAPDLLAEPLRTAFAAAEPQVRSISAAAFPAVVHATLARRGARLPPRAGAGARLKLLWAMARGRL